MMTHQNVTKAIDLIRAAPRNRFGFAQAVYDGIELLRAAGKDEGQRRKIINFALTQRDKDIEAQR